MTIRDQREQDARIEANECYTRNQKSAMDFQKKILKFTERQTKALEKLMKLLTRIANND